MQTYNDIAGAIFDFCFVLEDGNKRGVGVAGPQAQLLTLRVQRVMW